MSDRSDVDAVAAVMAGSGLWWAVAGGWAIDLWLGTVTREHHDIEVAVRRADQSALHETLANDGDWYALDPPGAGWRIWNGTPIATPAFQLQLRTGAVTFDLFTEDVDTSWHFRRDPRVTADPATLAVTTASGIPVVRPDVQLLYMARSSDPKNQHDFDAALPHLTRPQKGWLRAALERTLPDHPWCMHLTAT